MDRAKTVRSPGVSSGYVDGDADLGLADNNAVEGD